MCRGIFFITTEEALLCNCEAPKSKILWAQCKMACDNEESFCDVGPTTAVMFEVFRCQKCATPEELAARIRFCKDPELEDWRDKAYELLDVIHNSIVVLDLLGQRAALRQTLQWARERGDHEVAAIAEARIKSQQDILDRNKDAVRSGRREFASQVGVFCRLLAQMGVDLTHWGSLDDACNRIFNLGRAWSEEFTEELRKNHQRHQTALKAQAAAAEGDRSCIE